MKKAVFAGSFDPLTLGHLHLIERAARLCDELIVVVAANSQKHALFDAPKRKALIEENIRSFANVRVDIASGLLVEKMKELGAGVLIRGLRDTRDFSYEKQIAWANHELDASVETICLFAKEGDEPISSSIIREFARYGRDISAYVPLNVARAIQAEYARREEA